MRRIAASGPIKETYGGKLYPQMVQFSGGRAVSGRSWCTFRSRQPRLWMQRSPSAWAIKNTG